MTNYSNKFTKIKLYAGRSMIEMLGVLAIMGILTGATFQFYNYASGKTKALTAESQIVDTAQDVKTLFLGRNWDGFSRISDITSSEKYFKDRDIKMVDAWGNPLIILRTDQKDRNFGRFYIKMTNLDIADCINLGKRVTANLTRVNNVDVEPPAIPLCKEGSDNEIMFFYK